MDNGYSFLVFYTQISGLLLFIIIFCIVLFYALRTSNKSKFDSAAEIPLKED